MNESQEELINKTSIITMLSTTENISKTILIYYFLLMKNFFKKLIMFAAFKMLI